MYLIKHFVPWGGNTRYVTFLRRWNAKWTAVLKFRDASTFSQCDICQELKSQIFGLIVKFFCGMFFNFTCDTVRSKTMERRESE